VDSAKVYALLKERDTIRESHTTQTIVKTTNVITGWQSFWIRSGWLAWVIILMFVGIKYGWPLLRKAIIPIK
jgi:hypothetical protein